MTVNFFLFPECKTLSQIFTALRLCDCRLQGNGVRDDERFPLRRGPRVPVL